MAFSPCHRANPFSVKRAKSHRLITPTSNASSNGSAPGCLTGWLFVFNQPTDHTFNQNAFITRNPKQQKGPDYRTFSPILLQMLSSDCRALSRKREAGFQVTSGDQQSGCLLGCSVGCSLIACASTTLSGIALRYGVMVRKTTIRPSIRVVNSQFGLLPLRFSPFFRACQTQ